ncbi:DUF3310 domain-containing protein [Berryella intestinalis]|uniref:DUF3310 domain-containing protein n=1 Tax=Berryella intestinalis TaxID=1531429 RepID=UPI00068D2970|nr:DUF3310 domain-containing protein [Berryella intestinalis]
MGNNANLGSIGDAANSMLAALRAMLDLEEGAEADATDGSSSAEHDPVTAPAHYAGDGEVECKRAMESMLAGYAGVAPTAVYWAGAALKYLWRWPLKSGAQDVDKAIECLRILRAEIGGGR